MKQIGARQEAGRIGGIGACGRELCCASWMPSFSSVTTNAARMQEISLNPQKLAGQCSKLKCCLMYEYDTYADARRTIPRLREPLMTLDGEYHLIKIDPLAGTMSFSTSKNTIANLTTISTERVKAVLAMNRAGEKPESLMGSDEEQVAVEPTYHSAEDSIDRFDNKGRRSKRNKRNRGNKPQQGEATTTAEEQQSGEQPQQPQPKERRERPERKRRGERPERKERGEAHENREPREPRENKEHRERPERVEHKEGAERTERVERNDGAERTERSEHSERRERRGRNNYRGRRGPRPERGGNNNNNEEK